MFPVGDGNVRGAGVPWLTWTLIGINGVAFLYELTLSQSQLEQFIMTYGVVPAQIVQGQHLISLLTSMFLHAGWAHILGNMVFLAVFGDNVEAVLGKLGYLFFYLVGGLAASAVQILFSLGSQVPSLGASGAVAAVMGGLRGDVSPLARPAAYILWFLRPLHARGSAAVCGCLVHHPAVQRGRQPGGQDGANGRRGLLGSRRWVRDGPDRGIPDARAGAGARVPAAANAAEILTWASSRR
jgi:membrane associated rhomboid family serine protease